MCKEVIDFFIDESEFQVFIKITIRIGLKNVYKNKLIINKNFISTLKIK